MTTPRGVGGGGYCLLYILRDEFTGSKYDRVDDDRREKADSDTKAWFVEF